MSSMSSRRRAAVNTDIRKVLIVNIFGIGDVLFTTPLISQLKAGIPGVYIGYLANPRTAPLLSANPRIDKVFVYDRDAETQLYRRSKIQFLKKLRDDLREIKSEQFDLVIDLSLNSSTSFLMWAAGIKKRMGFNYRNRSPLLTHKIELEGYHDKHVAEYYQMFLEQLGITPKTLPLEIHVGEQDERWAKDILAKNDLEPSRVIGMVPGGGASWGKEAVYKRWSAENYSKLADKIIEKFSSAIILMGDPREKDLCAQVAKGMRHKAIQLAGQTSIQQLAALCRQCRFVVLNDGGPLHIAVAAGAKTVSIFGPVNENVYGPYPRNGHIVITKTIACRPCYRRFRKAGCDHISCLTLLTVDEVFERIQESHERAVY